MQKTKTVCLQGCYVFPLLAILVVISALATEAEEAGRQLAQQVYDRPDGKDASLEGQMILTEEGHEPRVRKLYSYRLDKQPGEVWSLIRFTAPADVDGTGLLTLDHQGGETDQWIYLPALDRARRIPSDRKGGRFVGSDLYYEDLQDREVSMDRHRLIGEDTIAGAKTLMLESIPVDPDNSVYSKRVAWIHPDTLIALRVDYYQEGRDEPIKQLTVHRADKVQGYWTVMDSTMTDLQSGHQTRMLTDKIVYDRDLPESLFSQQVLEDPSREAQFRP